MVMQLIIIYSGRCKWQPIRGNSKNCCSLQVVSLQRWFSYVGLTVHRVRVE